MQVLLGTPLLAFQAPLLDILPMYVMVMLLAPFLIWLRVQGELALLAASGLMWMFTARFFPTIPTMTYDVAWNFNPFCWQFLFAIGLAFGWRTRTSMPPVAPGESRRVLDICCVLFVAFSACVLMTIAFETIDERSGQPPKGDVFQPEQALPRLMASCRTFGFSLSRRSPRSQGRGMA